MGRGRGQEKGERKMMGKVVRDGKVEEMGRRRMRKRRGGRERDDNHIFW